jgi:hypothetical protein
MFTTEGIWRSGNFLVMRKDAQLPDRCIKTNQPANGKRFKSQLYWHQPWIYLLILLSLLIYLIVALIVRKKAIVHFGVTEAVLQKRTKVIWASVGIGLLGIVLMVVAASIQAGTGGALFLLGLGVFLGSLIWVSIGATLVRAERIEEDYVWLRGVSKEYLALLPEWNQPQSL